MMIPKSLQTKLRFSRHVFADQTDDEFSSLRNCGVGNSRSWISFFARFWCLTRASPGSLAPCKACLWASPCNTTRAGSCTCGSIRFAESANGLKSTLTARPVKKSATSWALFPIRWAPGLRWLFTYDQRRPFSLFNPACPPARHFHQTPSTPA